MELTGFALPYHTAGDVAGRRVVVARHAFRASLARGACVPVWLDHDRRLVVSPAAAVGETTAGLYFTAPVTDWPSVLVAASDRGDVAGASVSWRLSTERGVWVDHRFVLLEAELIEISVILRPGRPVFRETWVQLTSSPRRQNYV